jgi:integrase
MPRSFLRVHDPDAAAAAAAPPGMLFNTASGLSPQMRLSQFYTEWFLPVVLIGDREAQDSTITLYRDALDWWRIITGDPPVYEITDQMLARFKGELSHATYKRGRLGRQIKISRATVAKHLKALRALIYRLGPQLDARRATAGLLQRTPIVPGVTVTFNLKPCYTLEEAQAIAKAAASFDRPKLADVPAPVFWRRQLAMWYFTGLRSGTVSLLTRGCLARRDGRLWLDVPAKAVTKTGKGLSLWVHAALEAAIDLAAPPDTPLVPRAGHYRTVIDMHQQLQAAAGLPPERQLSPHAWRRTHGEQLKLVGLDSLREVLRMALDHDDAATTETHYTSAVNELRMRLPTLWPDFA